MNSFIDNSRSQNYNYVIFGSASDYFKVAYNDLNKVVGAKYFWKITNTKNRLFSCLYKINIPYRLDLSYHYPFQRVLYPLSFTTDFIHNKPICFVFFSRNRYFNSHFIRYLKARFPRCRIVWFAQDLLVHSYPNGYKKLQSLSDICISFDHGDVERENFLYHPLVYSKYDIPRDSTICESDVYFVGKAKDRLDKIIKVYEHLRDLGLKCDFHITGVKFKDQKYSNEIDYCKKISYFDNLKHIQATKCLLEIMQGGGHGYTLRYGEAIMYDKKILTDNPEITRAPFFDNQHIAVFKDIHDIDPSFILREPIKADYNYKEQLSPLKLLEFIDNKLQRIELNEEKE